MANAQGTVEINFGAFPGKAIASATVATGTISATSLVEVWPCGTNDTADHSPTEHNIEDFDCYGENIVASSGFTAIVRPRLGRCYGRYNFNWCWSD